MLLRQQLQYDLLLINEGKTDAVLGSIPALGNDMAWRNRRSEYPHLLGTIMFRARNTDPVTSWLAADSAKELAKHHATIIVDCLRKNGKLGKDGIANLTGLDSNQVARRVKEIERDGLICLTGQTVRSNSNRMEQEWQITQTQLTLI